MQIQGYYKQRQTHKQNGLFLSVLLKLEQFVYSCRYEQTKGTLFKLPLHALHLCLVRTDPVDALCVQPYQ